MKEVDLARKVIEWLIDQKWDVYQEVQPFAYGPIADIVAKQGKLIWVIESKVTLSLQVIGQAFHWTSFANYVSVAVPSSRRGAPGFTQHVLNIFGIGMLKISEQYFEREQYVREVVHPKLHRAIGNYLLDSLNDGHKIYAEAGNNEGKRWSPFKETCLQIYRYVRVNEGCTLKDVLNSVNHHYASTATARSCIPKWAEAGKIDRIKIVKEDGKWKFYTNEGGKEDFNEGGTR